MGWVRRGDCPPERCQGRCCTSVKTWYDKSPENQQWAEVMRVRGVRVVEPPEDPSKYLVTYEQRCQYLRDGLCLLHPDLNPPPELPPRPQFCWDWPQEPGQLVDEDCGFTFEWAPDPEGVIPIG